MLRLASLKYREIAAELGIATRAVSTLLARALSKLQAAVERRRAGLPLEIRKSRAIRRHYSNAELLEYFDGEVPWLGRRAIEKHLQTCWPCRTQLRKLERADSRQPPNSMPPMPARPAVPDHRQNFLEGIGNMSGGWPPTLCAFFPYWLVAAHRRRCDFDPDRRPCVPPGPSRSLPYRRRRSPRAPHGLMRSPPRHAMHQVFAVSLHQSRPVVRDRQEQLHLWSDPVAGRFCSRLEDGAGHLHLGLWRIPPAAYVYRTSVAGEPSLTSRTAAESSRRPSTAACRDDRFDFEGAFLDWLESREWQPILLGSETAIFRTAQGEWVRARRAGGRERVLYLDGGKDERAVSMIDFRGIRSADLSRSRAANPNDHGGSKCRDSR